MFQKRRNWKRINFNFGSNNCLEIKPVGEDESKIEGRCSLGALNEYRQHYIGNSRLHPSKLFFVTKGKRLALPFLLPKGPRNALCLPMILSSMYLMSFATSSPFFGPRFGLFFCFTNRKQSSGRVFSFLLP